MPSTTSGVDEEAGGRASKKAVRENARKQVHTYTVYNGMLICLPIEMQIKLLGARETKLISVKHAISTTYVQYGRISF